MKLIKGKVKSEVTGTLPAFAATPTVSATFPTTVVTLANAVEITDGNTHTYALIAQGGLTAAQVRGYKDFKISLANSHDKTASISVYTYGAAADAVFSSSSLLYYEATNLAATTGRLIIQSKAGGTGAAATIKVLPALEGLHSDLLVSVLFASAPTAGGALTIKVEMR